MYIGLDIGSVSVNSVLMTSAGDIREEHYVRTHGRSVKTVLTVLDDMLSRTPLLDVQGIGVTGTGGKSIAELLNCYFVNEIIAQSKATARLHPEVRTVIEIGGEDSKLILLEEDEHSDEIRVKDFAMNTVCAAGTGSFLDQQAARLGVKIEEEFGRLALKSKHPPRIAGRCSVFAKTDMIHLQQVATPDYDIVAGLCVALARNFKSNIAKGKDFSMPIAFQGGVAANAGMADAFERVLEVQHGDLLIPEHFASMGAIGAVLALMETGAETRPNGPEALEEYLKNRKPERGSHEPLDGDDYPIRIEPEPVEGDLPVDAFLGIDVGSISTNLVVIDRNRRVLARRYLMTAGRPIEAVRRGLKEIGEEVGDKVTVKGVCTTGSGRYLTGDFVGSDFVKNEITAHARGAAGVDPRVDTIFEIGGQDSKYISLENGAVVDFTMNKVCAAGTGSFLEEQAEKLGINIKEEFGQLALSCEAPARLGERCTVFMESDVNHEQQRGASVDELVAGLSYSIVLNYLGKVVEDRKIGDVIFFQGGTAYNRGVKAAFEKVTGKKVIVPPHHDVLGAVGSATIALEGNPDGPSKFKGFDLADRKYSVDSFECTDCPNNCEVRRVSIEGEPPLHYGSRCGKFDEEERETLGDDLPKLFAERQQMLMNAWKPSEPLPEDAPTVGLPRATIFWEMFPFWKAFFNELGFKVVVSSATNSKTVRRGVEAVVAETCFPIKVGHGHVLDLLERGVDYLLLPCVVNMEHICTDSERAYNCPYIQSFPYLVRAAIDLEKYSTTVLDTVFHMERGRRHTDGKLRELAGLVGKSGGTVSKAIEAAHTAQDGFREAIVKRGREVMANLPKGRPALVVVSRPYNGCDPGLNLRIPEKLRDMGALAIPLDFLHLPTRMGPDFKHMYWRYGQRILAAARIVGNDPNLNVVYVTNFGCGPDSFITKYFSSEMKGKPFLTIEVDEHSADAGVITRLEAFLDSLESVREDKLDEPSRTEETPAIISNENHRTVYIPHMCDHGRLIAASMSHSGVNAEPLPASNAKSLELGRKFTSGKECYPCIITTGDIAKKAFSDDFDPDRSSFLMPSASGPCRFGQYNRFHRMVLDELGFNNVPVVVVDQTVDYQKHTSDLGNGFRRLAGQGVAAVEYMMKLLLHTRPYEVNKGDADAVYNEGMADLADHVVRHGSVGNVPRQVRERMESISVDRSQPKPKIGIVGEIFVRNNEFSNNFFVRKIEELGGEAVMPGLEEWIYYIDWERKRDLIADGRFGDFIGECLKGVVQRFDVRRISRSFSGSFPHFLHEAPMRSVMKDSSRYLHEAVRGEANLSLGRAVEYAREGFHGVVNLIPFNCLPGTIVNALLRRFAQDYPQIPVLRMVYDGNTPAGEQTRVEAFMYQARQVCEAEDGSGNGRRIKT